MPTLTGIPFAAIRADHVRRAADLKTAHAADRAALATAQQALAARHRAERAALDAAIQTEWAYYSYDGRVCPSGDHPSHGAAPCEARHAWHEARAAWIARLTADPPSD